MRFNPNARLDTSQVQDRRGAGGLGGGGLGGINIGRGGLAGGGLGLIGIIAIVLFSMFSGGGSGSSGAGGLLGQLASDGGTADNTELAQECRTGADANSNDDCAVVAIVNSVQSFWKSEFAASGSTYSPAPTVFYSGATSTGCGQGSASMGPFYCPSDGNVYIDLSFWNQLKTDFGADNSTFTQAYVIAHEYGHHVQDLLGTSDKVGSGTGPTSGSVRLELQADCYAGVWAKHASTVAGADGQVLISDITDTDISNAVATAGKIGDDWIQTHLGGGQADPSSYTHGTSAQRQKWLTTGYRTGNPASCDTFSAKSLG
jgi:predicted metalloprotease